MREEESGVPRGKGTVSGVTHDPSPGLGFNMSGLLQSPHETLPRLALGSSFQACTALSPGSVSRFVSLVTVALAHLLAPRLPGSG